MTLKKAGDKLFHIYLSGNNRGFPGRASIEWKKVFAALHEIGYSGPLVVERYVFPDTPAGDDVCIWRPLEIDIDESLKRSILFDLLLTGRGFSRTEQYQQGISAALRSLTEAGAKTGS